VSAGKLIDARGIAKIFRSKFLRRPHTALADLDLSVDEGEIFGFLGPNGAGKTTTIKILLGLIRPTAGSGHVLGRPFGSVAARREVGFLPDSPNFYRYLTAHELLRFAGGLHGLAGADLERRVGETLDRVGLAAEARDRQLRTYSRGMLQRTGIAAAMLHRPRLVILDEPMNGLDPLGRHDFRDIILSLKAEGATVFFSSHVLADVESTADRVGILNGGRMVRCGSLQKILEGDGRSVEVAFALEPGGTLTEIAIELDNFRPGSTGWIGEAPDPDAASEAVRRVLAAGGRLLAYQRKRVSLEDFFVRQVTRGPEPGAPPAARPGPSGVVRRSVARCEGVEA
jgi:ABC-2 type transport system ATP-binding protein